MVLFPPQHVEPGHAIIVSHVGAVGDSCESSVIAVTTELPPGFLTLPADGDRSVAQLERKLSLLVLETLLTVRAPGLPLARLAAFLTQIARSTHKNALLAALANADVRTPLPGLYFASMSQVYPWDRGTNYAVEMGRNVAAMIAADHGIVHTPGVTETPSHIPVTH